MSLENRAWPSRGRSDRPCFRSGQVATIRKDGRGIRGNSRDQEEKASRKSPGSRTRPETADPATALEGRYQQALELAKQLYKYEPISANKELLKSIYLGRARQLRSQGYLRDAVTVLTVALQLDGASPDWLKEAAQELAACGAGAEALKLLNRLEPDPVAQKKLLGQLADKAVEKGKEGRNLLLVELQADFDRILQASAQIDAGQDEPARVSLQAVGLRSPFLEWKVMLRGLMAFNQQEDERALENWQRLAADRLPARVVAPLRFTIDKAYQSAQSPASQALLQKQADRLENRALVHQLRQLQKAMANTHSLSPAFRLAEEIVPALRQEAPALASRLAACFYWTVVTDGGPEDISRFQRVFGTPADDPEFARMRALALENAGEIEDAHRQWQIFERSVAAHPGAWPGDQAPRVRALVWKHMAMNAAAAPDLDRLPPLPPFLRDQLPRTPSLKPTAEECFRQSLKLAPDQLETHEELVHYYQEQEKPRKAEQAARELLKRFPTHVPTLQTLAQLRIQEKDYAEGISLLERAYQANPLDQLLRRQLSAAHVFQARAYAEAEQFDQARAEFRMSLSLGEGDRSAVYCKMAACEFKAGNPDQAEDYLRQALASVGSQLSVAFSMLIEIIRLKLPAKLKTRFNKDFNALLAALPDGPTAADIAQTAAVHRIAGIDYRGQKTHENKVLNYLKKAAKVAWTEEQLDTVCKALYDLKSQRLLQSFAISGDASSPTILISPSGIFNRTFY